MQNNRRKKRANEFVISIAMHLALFGLLIWSSLYQTVEIMGGGEGEGDAMGAVMVDTGSAAQEWGRIQQQKKGQTDKQKKPEPVVEEKKPEPEPEPNQQEIAKQEEIKRQQEIQRQKELEKQKQQEIEKQKQQQELARQEALEKQKQAEEAKAKQAAEAAKLKAEAEAKRLAAAAKQAEEEAKKALAHVGVKEENFTKSPFELSGGQKKRVAIAGVLAMNPKILILDEPTAGLDPQGRDDILDQIAALHKMRGITIILVSHSMEDIAKYVERLIVMNHGEMVFDDTPKNVFSHYKELEGMGLAAPQITYIMHALSENGLNVDTTATTVEEARDTILEALKKQKPSLLKKGGRSE